MELRRSLGRDFAILGLLLAFLAIFLAWFSDGANLISLYYKDGTFNTSPISSPTNQLVTITFVLYPIAILVAIWSVWTRKSTPWQGTLIAPAVVYMVYQAQGGSGITAGPALTLVAGFILAAAFITEWRHPGPEPRDYPGRVAPRESRYGGRGRFRMPRRIRTPLWVLFGIWIIMVGALYFGNFPFPQLWYAPDILSVIAGAWLGFRYFAWVANISDRGVLFLVTFGSLILAYFIASVFILPYDQATSPFNQFFGVDYSTSVVGLTQTFASFGTPLVIFIGLAMLYAGYKASRTIFVRYE